VTRIPERWLPGTFDIWLHSHQLWHAFILAGAAAHYWSAYHAFTWNATHTWPHLSQPSGIPTA
jgi:adiponectin receptor